MHDDLYVAAAVSQMSGRVFMRFGHSEFTQSDGLTNLSQWHTPDVECIHEADRAGAVAPADINRRRIADRFADSVAAFRQLGKGG